MEVKCCIIIFAFSILALLANEAVGNIDYEEKTNLLDARLPNTTELGKAPPREKRFIVSAIMAISMIVTAVSTIMTSVDLATDSAAFYPSIDEHKADIRKYGALIKVKAQALKGPAAEMHRNYEEVKRVQDSLRRWFTTMSRVAAIAQLNEWHFVHEDPTVMEDHDKPVPAFHVAMIPVSYAFQIMGTYAGVSVMQASAEGALTMTAAAVASATGVLATIGGAVQIGITIANGAKKRDRYASIAEDYKAHYEKLLEAEQEIEKMKKEHEKFMTDVRKLIEKIIKEDLMIPCDIGLERKATVDILSSLNDNWVIVLNGFIKLHEMRQSIQDMVEQFLPFAVQEGREKEQQLFQLLADRYPEEVGFIMERMREGNATIGTWSAWEDVSSCGPIGCGVSLKKRRRRCLDPPCIGLARQTIICSIAVADECSSEALEKLENPHIDEGSFWFHSTVIKYICSLGDRSSKYGGIHGAFQGLGYIGDKIPRRRARSAVGYKDGEHGRPDALFSFTSSDSSGVPSNWNAKEAAGKKGWLKQGKMEVDASSKSEMRNGGAAMMETFDESLNKQNTVKKASLSRAANSSQASRVATMIAGKFRRKRHLGMIFVQALNLITGTVSISVSAANFATDGAAFYPSIDEAKESMRNNQEWLDNNRDRLEKLKEDFTKTYEKHTNINIHYEGYKQAASIVITNAEHPVFTNPYNDEFVQSVLPSMQDFSKTKAENIMFGSLFSLGLGSTALSGMGLLGSFRTVRLMKVYQARIAVLYKINGFMQVSDIMDFMDDYHPRISTMSRGTGRMATVRAALKRNIIPDCFKSRSSINHQIHQAKGDPLAIRNNKFMFSLGALGFGLQVAGIVMEFERMKKTRDQYDQAAKELDAVVKKAKESDETLPEEMREMEDIMDDMARIVQYGLEQDGYDCQVNTDNVMFIAKTMKDVAVVVGNQGTRAIERYEGIKSQIQLVKDMGSLVSPHRLYQMLIRQSRFANMEDDIETLMSEAGMHGGTWADWQARGDCSQVCGISVKTLIRECPGDDCIGRPEKTEVCDWSAFNETEHQACVEQKSQNPLSEEQTDLDKALESVCRPNSEPTPYYTLKNRALGLVLAVDKSDPERVYLEREKTWPEENDNQIWRKEESQTPGNFVLAAKYVGRVLSFDVREKGSSMAWNLESSGRLKSSRWFVEGQNCDSTDADSVEVRLNDVENWANNPCQQWEMNRFVPPQD